MVCLGPDLRGGRPVPAARARGFTLLEVMIVVGIIALLAALLTYGFRRMQAASRAKLTSQLIANCQSLLREYDRATGMTGVSKNPVDAPGIVNEGAPDRNGPAVRNTRAMTALFRAIPVNQRAIDRMPPDKVWSSAVPTEGPVVLDAWNNPIIYVPAGGLRNVRSGGKVVTVTAPDEKPFFASAGADGSFAEGDDNVYAFEN